MHACARSADRMTQDFPRGVRLFVPTFGREDSSCRIISDGIDHLARS